MDNFKKFDEKCKRRSLNGRLTDAHQVVSNNASAFATAQTASEYTKQGAMLPRSRTKNDKTSM